MISDMLFNLKLIFVSLFCS